MKSENRGTESQKLFGYSTHSAVMKRGIECLHF